MSSQPWSAFVSASVALCQRMPFAALVRQAMLSFPGDPLVGQNLPHSTLPYVKATQVQQFISLYYQENGMIPPDNFDEVLAANAGPVVPWNYSYFQWGLA